jgi:hypothetical protein
MKSSVSASAIVAVILSASMALGNPIISRAPTCNVTPTASVAAPQVLASPAATTAAKCQEQCDANSACKCFAFGLSPDATAPTCRLFSVAAAQIPSQGTNINIFDKACTDVPTVAPTPSTTGGSGTSQGDQGKNQGQNQDQNQGQNQGRARGIVQPKA